MARIDDLLAKHLRIGLDTSPFIYLFERHPTYHPLVQPLFTQLKAPQHDAVTSVITLIETCVQPYRAENYELVERYRHALTNAEQVRLVDITIKIAETAIRLRAQHNIRVPDALQIATAIEADATLFITNDKQFKRVSGIEVVLLDDLLPA